MNFLPKENENSATRTLKIVFYVFLAVVLWYRLSIVFSYKHELVNGESNNLWNAINVAHGKPIYSNPEDLPLEVFQYTPLSQFPLIALAYVLNDESSDYLYWLTVGGRLVSLLLNIVTVWLAFKVLTGVYEVKRWWAVVAASWIFVTLTHPNFAIRPDAMLICALMGLYYLFALGIKNSNNKQLVLASVGVGFAVLIKQDAFLMIAPFALILFWNQEWKKVNLITISFLVGIALALSLGHLIFGEYFLYSITKGIQNESSASQAINVFDKANSLFGFQFIMAIVLSFLEIWSKKCTVELSLLAFSVLCYIGFGFFTSFKLGSWVNYYTVFLCLTPMLIVVFIKMIDISDCRWLTHSLVLLFLVNGGIFVLRQAYFYTLPWILDQQAKKEYYQKYEDVVAFKRVTHIQPGQYVLTGDQLYRNFLAIYSVMPNSEYYGVSKFDYSRIRMERKRNIPFIFYHAKSKSVTNFLISFFKVKTDNYILINRTSRFIILGRNE
jgi:hypothetical protein